METNKNYVGGLVEEKVETLFIFCGDTLKVKDVLNFASTIIQGMDVTYWMESENVEERINNAFDILFEEVLRTRGMSVENIK